MEKHYRTIFGFWALAFLLLTAQVKGQTPGGASGMVFRFTKQVWLNPTIILAKQNFEQSTNVKLLILPRLNGNDTTGSSKIEKAFDKLLSFLVYKDNVQGSIKFYFNPKNPTKPFTFNTSDELFCKFTPIQKDSVETILNQDIINSSNLNNFTALPFDSIINRASRYCKKILQSKPGQCGENPGNEFTLTKINSAPAKLNFEKTTAPTGNVPNGGVDKQKYAELAQYYNTVLDVADNSNYPMAWKAMAANKNDNIKLKLKKKQSYFDINKLVFKNAAGNETYNVTYSNVGNDSTIDLSMSGKSPGSIAEVVAYYTPTTTPTQTFAIGAFNVQFYESKTMNVVLVNLGGATLPDANTIKNSINAIYGNVFINWNVTTATCSLPANISKSIHVENSSLLSNYMPDMQPIVSYFKDHCSAYNGLSDNTFYLLFGASNDGNLAGYMPRARNTGFIFDNDARTIAHELGHGAFNLKHIFSDDELGAGNRTLTDNLMDYATESKLYKHQWDLVHNPGSVGWFEGDDDDGAAVLVNNMEAIKTFSNTNGSYTFITPGGKYITLPKTVKSLVFSTLDHGFYAAGNTGSAAVPFGALISFKDQSNINYSSSFSTNAFYGYLKEGSTTEYYVDNITATLSSLPQSGIAVFVGVKQGQFNYYAGKFPTASTSGLDPTNKGAGVIPNTLMIIAGTKADMEKNLITFLNSKKTSASIVTVPDASYKILSGNAIMSFDINNQNYTLEELTKLMLDENSSLNEYMCHFAFVNENSNQVIAFASCLEAQNTNQINYLKSVEVAAAASVNNGPVAVYTDRESSKIVYKTATAQELLKAAGNDTLLLHDLRISQTAQQIQQAFINHPGFSPCSLFGLNINTRISFLNKLLSGYAPDETYWFVNNNLLSPNENFIIKYLIETTPKTEALTLINSGLKNNSFEWLRNLWKEYDTWTNDVQLDDMGELFSILNQMVADNISQLNIQPITASKTVYTSLLNSEQRTIRPGMDELYMVGLHDGLEYGGIEYNLGNDEVVFNTNGKILFNESYTENYGYSASLQKDVNVSRIYNYTYDPLEPVTIKIMGNFYETNYAQNTEIVTTAFMAMWYAKSIDKVQNDRIKRLVFNGIVITAGALATPFTGGTSAVIANTIIDAGVMASAADMYISYKRNNMNQATYNTYKTYFESWDKVKTVVDIANAGVGGVQLTMNFATRLKNLKLLETVNEERTIWTNLNDPEMAGVKNAFNEEIKIISNAEAISSIDNAGYQSTLFNQSTLRIVNDFDNFAGRIVGYDDVYIKCMHKLIKSGGSSAADDVIYGVGNPTGLPKSPISGGTSSATEATEVVTELEADLNSINISSALPDGVTLQSTQMVKYIPAGSQAAVQSVPKTTPVQVYSLPSMAGSPAHSMLVLTAPSGQKQVIYMGQEMYNKVYEKEKNKQQCQTCTKFDQGAICQKFTALKNKVANGYYTARTKLCSDLTFANVNSVLDNLNGLTFNITQLNAFLNQLNSSRANSDHIVNKIGQFDTDILKAFKQMYAHKSIGYWADYKGLSELKQIMNNSSVKNALGDEGGINIILEKNTRLPCSTCDNTLAKMYLNPMDEYLKDVSYFAQNFTGNGASDVLNGSGIKSNQIWHVEGAAFMLRVIRTMALTSSSIAGFEYKYADNDEAVSPNEKEVDIITVNGTLIECKSWYANGISFQHFVAGQGNSYSQFIGYLQNITSMSGLQYWFDVRKATEAEIKGKFKDLLFDPAANSGQGGLTPKGMDIWNIIKLKPGILSELNINNTNNTNQFINVVSNIQSDFYDFILLK